MVLMLKTAKSPNLMTVQLISMIFGFRGGPKWVPKGVKIASETVIDQEIHQNPFREGSKRAPRAKKSSLGASQERKKVVQDASYTS